MNQNKKSAGIKATNQEFRKYEQVKKDQTYGLSELEGVDEFDDDFEIKTCDLGLWLDGNDGDKQKFADRFGAALEEIGFAVLTNHGVPTSLYEKMEAKVVEFFETTPRAERQPFLAKRQGSVNQGYFPINETTIIHPDLVEGWVFCRRAFNLDNNDTFSEKEFWPRPGYEPVFRKVVQAHEALIKPITEAMLAYLGCDPKHYDRALTRTNFGFRLNYYPAMTPQQSDPGGGRMLGHEDVDLFTILPASNQEGLQVLNRKNMKWIRLNPPKGSIIINTGDYIQRITNDRLPSTTHRVAKALNQKGKNGPRISFPMAVYVWENEILEVLPGLGVPKYDPIRAEDFHTRITSKYYGDDYTDD